MRWVTLWPALVLAVGGALALPGLGSAPLEAQDLGTDCDLEAYSTIRSSEAGPGRRVTWISRPIMRCPDGTRIRSDSAVVYQESQRAELIGNVHFQTDVRLLESRLADFYERENRLYARGDVHYTDRVRDSELRGDTLTYLGETAFRAEEQITVTGARPNAVLRPERETTGPTPPEPYRVTGNRLRFEGERFFWADGDVEVLRDDLEAYADSLAFDQEVGTLFLSYDARVLAEDTEMSGHRINLTMPEDILEQITIRERGRLVTDDLELVGEEIRIELEDEKIQRLVAVHREPADPDDPRPRPWAVTEEFALGGDSIDVRSPDEILETVHAVGRARGESRARGAAPVPVEVDPDALDLTGLDLDHLLPGDPEEEEEQPEPAIQVDRDWIEGDEILATFERVPSQEPDDPEADEPGDEPGDDPDAAPTPASDDLDTADEPVQYRLSRLEARGNARTLYRSPPDDEEGEPAERDEDEPVEDEEEDVDAEELRVGDPLWSISYIKAQEIIIYMLDGAVDRVEAKEQVMGLQLQPDRERP